MSKIRPSLPRVILAGVLAIGASAITTTAATAQPKPVLAVCANVVEGETFGQYEDALCSEAKAHGDFILAFPDHKNFYWACTEEAAIKNFSSGHCNEAGTGFGLVEAEEVTGSEPELRGSNIGISTLKGTLAGSAATISCKSGSFSDEVEASGKQGEGKLAYTSCKSVAPANCTVKEPIDGNFEGQLEESSGKFVNKFTGTKTSGSIKEIYTEIEYTGCSTLGGKKFPVSGSQTCEGEGSLAVLRLLQTVICKASGSNLKLGTSAATYEGKVSVTLKEGWSWAAATGKVM